MLATQLLDIPIATGIDEKTDRHLVARMRSLLNGRVLKTGAVEKRAGTICLASTSLRLDGSTAPTPEGCVAFGNELLRFGGGELDTVLTIGSSPLVFKDRYPNALAKRIPIAPFGQYDADVAHVAGFLVVTYLSRSQAGTDQVCVDVSFAATGTRVLSRHVVASATAGTITNPKVVVVGSRAIVGYRATTTLVLAALDVTTMTWTGPTLAHGGLVTVAAGDGRWDMTSTGTEVITITEALLGANRVMVGRYNASTLAVIGALVNLAGVATTGHTALAVHYGTLTGRVHVGLGCDDGANTLIKTLALSADLATVHWGPTNAVTEAAGSTVARVTIVDVDASNTVVAGDFRTGASGYARIAYNAQGSTGTPTRAANAAAYVQRASLLSKAWLPSSADPRVHVLAVNDHVTHGTGGVLDLGRYTETVCRLAATVAPRQLGNQNDASTGDPDIYRRGLSSIAGVSVVGDYAYTAALSGGEPDVAYRRQVEVVRVRTLNTGVRPVETVRPLAIAGGAPSIYDRQQVSELGFWNEPDVNGCVASGSSTGYGNLDLTAAYSVRFVYAWTDALGDVHRSAPSTAVTYTTAGAENTITITNVPSLHVTNRVASTTSPPVFIEVYRTEGNGAIWYLDQVLTSTAGGANQSVELSLTDVVLRTRRRLYTTGGALDHVIPPSAGIIHTHQGAVVLGDTDDDRVWLSFPVVEGDGLAFNDELVLPPFEGGAVTAFASLDDILVIFKADSIWIVQGELPGENGLPIPSVPRRLQSDIGCTQPRSIVVVPEGVLFMSRAGYALLDRGFNVALVGKPIEDTLDTGAADATAVTITSAVAMPSESVARVTHGRFAANYDYLNGGAQAPFWTRNSYRDPADLTITAGDVDIAGACLWQGTWTYINVLGHIYQESKSTWRDTATGFDPQWVTMSGTSHPIEVGGVAGWQRSRRLHTVFNGFSDAFGLTFGLLFDDDAAAVENASFTIPATSQGITLQRQKHIARQKSRAFYVTFSDAADAASVTGRGMALTGFQVEIGVKKGPAKLPAASRA